VAEIGIFILGALTSMLPTASAWVSYLAFEPYVRRRWPQSIITWSRVLAGGFRDPLVGGHLLFGVALGVGLALLRSGDRLALEHYGTITAVQLSSILSVRGLIDFFSNRVVTSFLGGMLYTFILMVLRVLLRRQWLAAAAFVPTGGFNTASGSNALTVNTTGTGNTAIGVSALQHNTIGSNNIGIGFGAANNVSGGNSNNIHIGSDGSSGDNDSIRIGDPNFQSKIPRANWTPSALRGVSRKTSPTWATPVMI
jgi:hypothetical protein